ncbi:Chromosome partition protein Smc [Carpediemonas membranifera]|uniref:Chromosome partition protein Smc n=1 Tax=Carpediemonas membranifera TaxID=201153 RepID=A0A8J6E0S7_9EUKA|nr:Chromosome partition protein Smc [Carpediemonas membranifera]|eukprot:KAG9395484.1 Chromosome partition protein Smc [Carpediemonas membranifera]
MRSTGTRSRNPYSSMSATGTGVSAQSRPQFSVSDSVDMDRQSMAGTRTADSFRGGAASMNYTSATQGQSSIEKEYVYNLQQQVYFLELESKLMREKLADPGPRLKDKGCAADPLDDPELDQAKPLDDHIKSLKMKYVEQKEQFKRDHEEMVRVQEDLRSQVTKRNRAIEVLEQKLAKKDEKVRELDEQYSEHRTELLLENEGIRKEVESRDRTIKQMEMDLAHQKEMIDKMKQQNVDLQSTLGQLKDELRQATMGKASPVELDRRQEEISKLTVDVKDLRAKIEEQKMEIENAKTAERSERDARWKVEGELDEIKAAHRISERQVEQLKEQTDQMREANISVKAQLDLLTTDFANAEDRVKRLVAEKEERDTEQRIAFEKSKQVASAAVSERSDAEAALKEARVEIAKTNQTLMDLEANIEKLNHDLAHKDQQVDEMANELAEQRALKREAENRRDGAEAEIVAVEEERDKAKQEAAKAKADADFVRQKSHIREDLTKLQQQDFERMRQTNDELTATIAGLMDRLNALSSSRGLLDDMSKDISANGSYVDRMSALEEMDDSKMMESPIVPQDDDISQVSEVAE